MNLGPLMVDVAGSSLTKEDIRVLSDDAVGGVILFSRNYEHPEQLARLTDEIRAAKQDLIIGVDHEGGRVQRFREGFTHIPPAMSYGQFGQSFGLNAGLELASDAAYLMARELRVLGVDFSFAPVIDVDTGVSEVIGDRAFGNTPEMVIQYASAFIDGLHTGGMPAIGKHFPGHGSVKADSHVTLPIDERDKKDIFNWDIKPFEQLVTKLDGIMPAHVVYPSVSEHAAGFSKKWLKKILVDKLGFKGVIVSDDMDMAGARVAGDVPTGVSLALDAGCHVVLICNNRLAVQNTLKTERFGIDAGHHWQCLRHEHRLTSDAENIRMLAAKTALRMAMER